MYELKLNGYSYLNDNYQDNRSTTARNPNPNYIPPATNPNIPKYNIETFHIEKDDVILAHLSKDCDIKMAQYILEELNKAFPENTVLLANEYILQGLTIIKPPVENVNIQFDNNIELFNEDYDWLL